MKYFNRILMVFSFIICIQCNDTNLCKEIPFILINDIIVVQGAFNSSEDKINLLFDTGSSNSMLTKAACSKLNMEVVDSVWAGLIDAFDRIPIYQCQKLRLGCWVTDSFLISSTSRNKIIEDSTIIVEGILGRNVLSNCNYILDFSNQNIIINPQEKSLKNLKYVPFCEDNPVIEITIKIGGKNIKGRFLIDTGCTDPILLTPRFIDSISGDLLILEHEKMIDVDEYLRLYEVKYDNLIINDDTLNSEKIYVLESEYFYLPGNIIGIVGAPILRKYNIYFDNILKRCAIF